MDKVRLLMEDERKKVRLLHKTNPEVGEEVTELGFGEEYKCKVVEKEDMLRVKVHYKGWSAGHDDWVSLPKSQGGGEVAVRKDLFRDTPTETKGNKEEEGELPSKPSTKPKEEARGRGQREFSIPGILDESQLHFSRSTSRNDFLKSRSRLET